MTIKQRFTNIGIWGALLFILSPIGAGFTYTIVSPSDPYDASPMPFFIVGIFFAIQCAAASMMLVGREYQVEKSDT